MLHSLMIPSFCGWIVIIFEVETCLIIDYTYYKQKYLLGYLNNNLEPVGNDCMFKICLWLLQLCNVNSVHFNT